MRWKKVAGFENYEVSETGLVRVIEATVKKSAGEIVAQVNLARGYKGVGLMRNGKQIMCKVHRLVALAFLPPPENTQRNLVAHNDGSCDNNHFQNLRWATCKENLGDRACHGTTLDGARNGRVKLTAEQVIEIRRRYKPRHKMDGAAAMAKEFGVTDVAIIKAARGDNWKSVA